MLHLHMIAFDIACFCIFMLGDSVIFQNMHNSAPYHITGKTSWKAGKFCQWRKKCSQIMEISINGGERVKKMYYFLT